MRKLILIVLMFLTHNALAEILLHVSISDQTGQQTRLGGEWRIESIGWPINLDDHRKKGSLNSEGETVIKLHQAPNGLEGDSLAIRFLVEDYEQVTWVIPFTAIERPECQKLNLRLNRNPVDQIPIPDSGDSQILNSYYSSKARSLYILLSDQFLKGFKSTTYKLVVDFQNNVNEYLRILPVIPPPPDITVPANVSIQLISDFRMSPSDSKKIQIYGSYLEALAMINGGVSGQECIRFDYHTIPFLKEFGGPVREVVYGVPGDDVYKQISERWGFYTVLALCIRDVLGFDHQGDQSRLERVRAFLVAERSQLGPHESLKSEYIQKLLDIVDQKLGNKGSTMIFLYRQLQNRLKD